MKKSRLDTILKSKISVNSQNKNFPQKKKHQEFVLAGINNTHISFTTNKTCKTNTDQSYSSHLDLFSSQYSS